MSLHPLANCEFDCRAGLRGAGFLAPGPAGAPAVVVLQEWWGLNPQIRDVAERLAGRGYSALAPDLYDGRVTTAADEAGHLMDGLDWMGATTGEVRGALRHLRERGAPRVAVLGFCMGGALAVIAAAHLQECDAAVCFYGVPPHELASPASVAVPLQGHFAERDDWCTPALVDDLEAGLRGAGAVAFEIHRYAAGHGFFNAEQPAYDPGCAALAWERSLAFLARHLHRNG